MNLLTVTATARNVTAPPASRRRRAAGPRLVARALVLSLVAALVGPIPAVFALDLTSVTLRSSANPATAGSAVTFDVTVGAPAGSATPTGTITLLDGVTIIGSCSLISGACPIAAGNLTVGSHAITARYGGDASHDPSTSDVLIQAVTMGVRSSSTAATSSSTGATSLAVTVPAGTAIGDALVASVSVTGGSGVTIGAPGWTRLPGSDLSSGTFLRQGLFFRSRTSGDTASSYTFTFSTAQKASAILVAVAGAVATAPRSIGAAYAAATSFTTPTLALGATAISGLPLAFLGVGVGTTITSVGNGYTATTSVAATGGKTASQTTTGAGKAGQRAATSVAGASFTTGASAVGIGHTVFLAQAPAVSAVRVTASAVDSMYGTPIDYGARVDPSSATGYVTLFADGSVSLGTCLLTAGACTVPAARLATGSHSIVATYTGDGGSLLASTSAALSVNVTPAPTTTVLTSSPNPSEHGIAPTLRATVSTGDGFPANGSVSFFDDTTPLGSCTLGSSSPGVCSFTPTTALAVGTHSLVARYGGDTNLQPSVSATVAQVVTRSSTRTAVAFSANPAEFGVPLTITVSVTSGDGTPTGTATVLDGGLAIGTCTLGVGSPAGSCAVVTSSLSIGLHSIGADYSGDTDRAPSSAGAAALTVNKASSTIALTGSPNPSTYGSSVTLRASITTGDATVAVGSVTFSDGTAALGSCSLGATYPAACQVVAAGLTIGTHSIVARFAGDTRHVASSATLAQVVGKALTTTRVTSSLNPAPYGTSVSFGITVSSAGGTPTGRVALSDGSTAIGGCDLSLSGTCSIPASLSGGTHQILATYLGDALRADSTGGVTQSITRSATSTSLSLTASGTLTYGNSVTLTATVSDAAATGSVSFSDGTTGIGTCTVGSLSSRTCAITLKLGAGTHSLTATYLGDTNYAPSTSIALATTIARASTSTALAGPSTIDYGSPVTLTATVSPATATGIVSFSDGTAGVGTCTLGTLASGSCELVLTGLVAGGHSFRATYLGDVNHVASLSPSVTTTVVVASSSTSLVSSANPAGVGQPITLTVTVSPATAPGSVAIAEGATVIGTCTLVAGTCAVTTDLLGYGEHPLVASYGGDSNHTASISATLTQLVRTPTTVTATSGTNPSVYGNAVSFAIEVATGDGSLATGRVSLSDGTTPLGSCALSTVDATCTIGAVGLSAGSRTVAVRYEGDADHGQSTTSVTQVVDPAPTTIALSSSANPSTIGDSVTFSATVTTGDGSLAVGTVTLVDGATSLGTCALTAGRCTYSTSVLAGGTHQITASFPGDANHTGSSVLLAQVVNFLPSSTSASANPVSATYGTPVTLTATVSPSAASGTVSFIEGGTTFGTCTLGTPTAGTCSITTSVLVAGGHTITARYSGDLRYATSQGTVSVTIAKGSSTTTLAANSAETSYGTPIVLTATVAPSVATGTISFSDGSTPIGTCTLGANSGGICSLTTATLAIGTHSVSARFLGNTNLIGSVSGAVSLVVNQAATSIAMVPSANPVTFGTGTLRVTVTPTSAAGTITITDGGLPFASCTLISGSCSVSLVGLAVGSHALTATYPGDANYGASASTLALAVSIGFRSAASAATGGAGASSVTVAAPSSVSAGDVLVAVVTVASSTATITPPSGWTRLGTDVVSSTAALTQGIFWRTAPTGSMTSSSWTFSSSLKGSAVIVVLTGASTTLPASVQYKGQVNASAVPQIYTPPITLPAPTRGLTVIFGGMALGTSISSVGTGYTLPASGGSATSSGGKASSQTTSGGAYSGVTSGAYIPGSQINTSTSTGAVSISHAIFITEGI